MAARKERAEAGVDFPALWSRLKSGEPGPVHILYGSQDEREKDHVQFLIYRTVAILRTRFLSDPAGKYNVDTFQGSQVDMEQALASARTVPMFGSRRLTLVLDLPEIEDEDVDRLVRYIKDPPSGSTLVVTVASGKLSRRLHSACKPLGCIYRAERLREREMPRWIEAGLADRNLQAEQGVARTIAEYTGTNLQVAEDTLEKLAIVASRSGRVGIKDVEECVLDVRQSDIFELIDALGARNSGLALSVLRRLESQRTDMFFVNNMLARQIRQLVKLKSARGSMRTRDEIAERLGIHAFSATKLMAQVRNFSMTDLERALDAAVQFEIAAKSSRVPAERLMEAMVLTIVHGQEI